MAGKLNALMITRPLTVGLHSDGDGLYLQVGAGTARSWIYRYALNGRTRQLGLGSAKAISLREARELAAEARNLRAKKIDPIDQRRQDRLPRDFHGRNWRQRHVPRRAQSALTLVADAR